MNHPINRRTLLGSGLGAFGAAAAWPSARAAESEAGGHADPYPQDASCWATPLAQDYTVIARRSGGTRVGSSGLARLPDGMLVAATTIEEEGGICQVSQSSDGGRNWHPTARVPRSTGVLWQHQGTLYMFATKWPSDLWLLSSTDAGKSWSQPVTLFEGHFWNVQTGMAIRDNRIYWAVDDFVGKGHRRGPRVVAADLSADLMDPKSWRISNHVPFPGLPESLLNPNVQGSYPSQRMLEPNLLEVNGQLRVLAAVKPPLQATTNLAAVFEASDDGENIKLEFTQFHPMPGGQVKFCIVRDEVSELFWATVNLAADGQDAFALTDPAEHRSGGRYSGAIGGNDRRFLMLFYGIDGLNWFPAGCVARAGRLGQAFQYPTMIVDGDDLAIAARSSVDAQNRHDADTATFHRVCNFRRLAMNLRQDV